MRSRDIRVASFEPTGRTTLVVMNYDSLVHVIRPARVAQYLNRVRPGRDTVLVVDELPDAEEQFPLELRPGYRLWHGWWFDEHCENKKGSGNSWKVHRRTKFWGGVNRDGLKTQPLISRH
jgi:hypothetical protein